MSRWSPVSLDEKYEVDPVTDCWVWKFALNRKGYAVMGGGALAHRVFYEMHRDEIPFGMTLDHLCENKSCVNPDHLEPVTRGENVKRWAKRASTCRNGHPRTAENSRFDVARGHHHCRACRRERTKGST